jgi:hypothetical protein
VVNSSDRYDSFEESGSGVNVEREVQFRRDCLARQLCWYLCKVLDHWKVLPDGAQRSGDESFYRILGYEILGEGAVEGIFYDEVHHDVSFMPTRIFESPCHVVQYLLLYG